MGSSLTVTTSMTLHLHSVLTLLLSLHLTDSAPQQGYGYRNRLSAYTYSQPPVYPATYSYQQYQPSYSYSNNYPVYPQYSSQSSYSSWYSPYSSSYSYSPQTYQQQQQPQQYPMSYMLNDLTYPATFSSSSVSSPVSTSSAVSSGLTARSEEKEENDSPAWQGRVGGTAHTKCHDGTLLPFRARCNKVVECQQAEDEYDCEWYKRSSIPSIHSFTEFTQVLNENDVVLVEFFAPWCPACVTFLPVLEDIDKTLTYENQNLAIYKVNTNENPDLRAMFNVNTFPRVLLFDKNKGVEPRTYEKAFGMKFQPLYKWLKKQLDN